MLRTILLFLLLPVLGLAACGEDPAPEAEASDEELLFRLQYASAEQLDPMAELVGKRAQDDPELLEKLVAMLRRDEPTRNRMTFTFRLADPAGLADGDARRTALHRATEIMAYRLRAHSHPHGNFDNESSGDFVTLRMPKALPDPRLSLEEFAARDRAYGQQIVRHLTAPGRVELMIVVPPPAEGQEPPSLWTGTAEAYEALVATEAARIDAAIEAGGAYAPGKAGFVVCAVPPASPEDKHGYLVTHRGLGDASSFTRDDFMLHEITFTELEQVGLELTLNADRAAAFKAFTAKHLGRELVLVVNGVAGTPMKLLEPIDGKALLPYGKQGDENAHRRVSAVTRVLKTQAHPLPVVGERVTKVAPNTISPAGRALVGSGEAGAKRMSELRREGGEIGARAARILELIARRRTSGGERYVPGNN